jgi:hypothetical protein
MPPMDNMHSALQQLRDLVGLEVRHQGDLYLVIDVIEDGPSLVLQDCQQPVTLQNDAFGDGLCPVPHTLVLPLWQGESDEINPEFLNLCIADPRE